LDFLICSPLEIQTKSGVVGISSRSNDSTNGSNGRFGGVRLKDNSKRLDST
jgi:hypothetical protein